VFANNRHVKGVHPSPLIGIHLQENRVSVEYELRVGELEVLCCAHKLREGRDRKYVSIRKDNLEPLEEGGHSRKKCFQVSATASEPEPAKVRECNVS
jgi:hypothetical protein